jgi:hypothetical protein
MPMHIVSNSPFVEGLPDVEGLTPPSTETRTFLLLDDDAKVCRIIPQDELDASYVDNNISTYQLDGINPLTLDVDVQQVNLNYASGAQSSILVGIIDWDTAIRADQYVKRDGLIYPVDDAGNLMLNVVNTPNLVRIRKRYHDDAKAASSTDVEFATIVYEFSHALDKYDGLEELQ